MVEMTSVVSEKLIEMEEGRFVDPSPVKKAKNKIQVHRLLTFNDVVKCKDFAEVRWLL